MNRIKPLLSICIPTRNRADVLKKCIDAIIYNPVFSDKIEIVVSDNESEDNTKELMLNYTSKHSNIKYYRIEKNIGVVKNFIHVIDLATGIFRKPINDYSVFTENGISYLLEIIENNIKNKPCIVFNNIAGTSSINSIVGVDINQLIEHEGWALSWMGVNGFWEEEWISLDNKEAYVDIMFVPIDYLLRLMEVKKRANIYEAHFSDRYPFKQKQGGYNFFKVHTDYFLFLFKIYYREGKISKKSFDCLNYSLFCSLLPFLNKLYITEKDCFNYELNGSLKYLFKNFKHYPWFYKKMIRWCTKTLYIYTMNLIRK